MDIEAKRITFHYDLEDKETKTFSSRENMKIHIDDEWVGIEKADKTVTIVLMTRALYYEIED